MDADRSLDRVRTENRIMAEIAGLAASQLDYADVVHAVLNLVEQIRSRVLSMGFARGTVELTVELAQVKPGETLSAEGFLRRGEQTLHEAKRRDRGWKDLWLAERPPAPW